MSARSVEIGLKAPAMAPAVVVGETVTARAARDVVRYAAEHGVRPADLLAAAGLDPKVLRDPEARVPGDAMTALWEAAAVHTGDPDFGLHLGTRARPHALSLIGYAMMSAATLGEAFRTLVRYFALFTEGTAPRLDPGGQGCPAAIEFSLESGTAPCLLSAPRHPMESTLAMLMSLTEVLTERRLPVRSVTFAHGLPPTGTATHQSVFGVVPQFGASHYRLAFDARALRWPVVTGDSRLHGVLEREAEQLMGELNGRARPLVSEVVVRRLRHGVPTLREVAADLGVGDRTLQRLLAAEGTSFRAVVDEERCALACRYLARSHATLQEVAFFLWFSEQSAFQRAFKRWTGITPRAWRKRHQPEFSRSFAVASGPNSDAFGQ